MLNNRGKSILQGGGLNNRGKSIFQRGLATPSEHAQQQGQINTSRGGGAQQHGQVNISKGVGNTE